MKYSRVIAIIGLLNWIYWMPSAAQRMENGVDLSFLIGVNIGFTTPVPVPKALDITKYNPRFNPKFGANLAYFFNEKWGVGTGFTVDWKGMNVHTEVSDVHLSVDVPNVGTLTGYVTGKNTTQVQTVYLTQPLYGVFRFNPKWQVKGGIYLAEAVSRSFKGDVSDVDIVVETPVMQEREVSYATLNYKDDVRKFDTGLLLGGEFKMNEHIGFYLDFTWGFTPYFSSEVPIHFTMRNIYSSAGVSYRFR